MIEAMLICALSLPAAHSGRLQMTEENRLNKEIERLRDFIHQVHPEAEIYAASSSSWF